MSGHTPGKWLIRFDKGHTFSDGTVDHGGYRIDADGVEQLAYVWNFSDRIDPVSGSQDGTRPFGAHEAEANARLIAAAPVLLEELRNATVQMDMAAECIEAGRYDEALLHVRSMERKRTAAIAKATGETK
ncbi:hypothetical protein [Rhodanobacter lindaniclasticus]|uniref:Uncharacterized protein n=1 Tax=Rhodanobacter lindaniclasticus TaxID=75310 RepID=A0A4S3KCQ0_9GAMM|nr:hypothetical protein [Rhodanobacter lindaniclasticus]THD06149.1 hypothetical protein B1991_14495 [Rhodanobacter lindaniclasticus]